MADPAAPRLILGTAGHIDHGKTALVKALSGVDCDRLPEEKARGITIQLGFAPLDLPSGARLGVVDVPGHERLVRTMVSGATGIDLVLFVVAADEGMMPQSREHLAICDLLGIDRGVVALTKVDAVDDEMLELARLDVEEELRGSPLRDAPILPVSAHRGDGLPELLAALDALAEEDATRTRRSGPAWLPVDRAFSMRGFGTVATGTLRGGAFEEGQTVELLPESGRQVTTARIRGLQRHGETVKRAEPGARCAVNLQGVEVAAVPRGSVIAEPGRLDYRRRLGVELRLLPSAPPLRSGASATFHQGTAERGVRVQLLDRDELAPGGTGFAELRLDRPLPVVEGDRYILRGFQRIADAGWTVGGGHVVDAAPLRSRRVRAVRLAELREMAEGGPKRALAVRLRRAGLQGVLESDLRREVASIDELDGVRIGQERWLDPEAFDELAGLCVRAVEAHHAERPTDPWVGLASVASALPPTVAEESIRAALDHAARRGALEAGGSGVRLPGHAAHVADPELLARVAERLAAAGLGPPTQAKLAEETGSDPASLVPVLEHLVREGRAARVAQGLFFDAAAVESLRGRVTEYLEEHGQVDPAAYKQLTGQTRKHTVPLMEYFDAEKLTVRRGNVRVLRGR
ncbi:MAG: selenocysteine-specific translation elongation factor [Deltaproteobacteria bacterium]|nr:selenocysteine-specific translation elongation factor [Deltaproteobacteria bacterium]